MQKAASCSCIWLGVAASGRDEATEGEGRQFRARCAVAQPVRTASWLLPFLISRSLQPRPSAMPRRRKANKEEQRADREEEEEEDGGVPAKLTQPTSVCINPVEGDDSQSASAAAASSSSAASAAASPLYYIPAEIAPMLKAHQIAGIRFMFRAVAGTAPAAAAAAGGSSASSRRRTSGAAILAHFCGLVRGGERTRARAARTMPRGRGRLARFAHRSLPCCVWV